MKKITLICVVLILSATSQSQTLAAFNDNLHRFWVFDGGSFVKLEYLQVQEFQVGGILVAYIDNGSNLKVYCHGQTETLLTGAPIKFTATDYLLGYSIYEQLNVYDNGKKQVLSTQCDGYIVQDSLIGWHNQIDQTIQVYYNGKIFTIEDGLIYNPIGEFKTGDNIIAYIQRSTQEFKIFYHGKLMVLEQFVTGMNFEAGREIIAYTDSIDRTFKVFCKGKKYDLETFTPKSFKVGDEMMVYVDNLGRLKYFENGEVKEISTFEPKFYDVTDQVMVFEEQGFFKTYCNGQVYTIEQYIPQPYKLDFNTIAYLDQNSFVKAFQFCEPIIISYKVVKDISLIRNLIIFVEGINNPTVYFNGQIYQFP